MHLPNLQPGRAALQNQDLFFGLNHNLRLRTGEFYDMENLTSDRFPVLSPRNPRRVVKEAGSFQGLTEKEGLCWVEGTNLYLNGKKTDLQLSDAPEDCPKQLISMGAYLIILPDRKYLNTADPGDWGNIDGEVTTAAPVAVSLCTLDGREIRPEYSQQPKEAADGSYWLDREKKELRQYAAATGLWVLIETPYVKLQCPGLGKPFRRYDGVRISGDPGLQELAGAAIVYGCGEDYLIIPGLIPKQTTLTKPVTVSRRMPRLDYCIESGNRLWGCRYGLSNEGRVVNEIYCSKLGDFRNWSCYLGISTDSYTASVGSDGPFTGAVSWGGYPLFFKERYLHKVFGQMPSNFQVQTTACRGVEQGSDRSLAIVREILYYKSPEGICAYDGSLPREISQCLGEGPWGRAVAGGIQGKYYISMEKQGNYWLYVYDTEKNLWHKEDRLEARMMCACQEELFCVDGDNRLLGLLGKTDGTEEGPVSWMAESGIIGVTLPGSKYLGKLSFRMLLDPGSQVTVSACYDSTGDWEVLGTVRGMNLRSFTFPVLPRRCDHLRLRLEGKGRALLFAVTATLRTGSTCR